jgi:hypothetical protein
MNIHDLIVHCSNLDWAMNSRLEEPLVVRHYKSQEEHPRWNNLLQTRTQRFIHLELILRALQRQRHVLSPLLLNEKGG